MKSPSISVADEVINDLVYTGTHVLHVTGTLSVAVPIDSILSSIPSGLKDFESFVLSADYHALNRETYHGYLGIDQLPFLPHGVSAMTYRPTTDRKMGILADYNFHQAFHPVGYYSPPFGETPTIEVITDTISSISKPTSSGPCPYNPQEDFQLFGMITTQNRVNSLTANMGFRPIFEPSEECPPEILPRHPFYSSVTMALSAGTMMHGPSGEGGGIGGNFYNDNPIPASIDTKNIFHAKISPWDLISVRDPQLPEGGYRYYYRIDAKKHPIPIIPSKPNHDKLNNTLCKARSLETNTLPGIGFVGLQLGSAQGFHAAMNDQYNFGGYDAWNMWHFYFRYNHWNYPFQGSHDDAPRLVGKGKFDTQVAEEHWWEHRQCADTNDFLPWTTSTTIKACPSDYFDVPYYSTIKRFGFYGTRFQNACKKIDFIQTGRNGEIVADFPNQSAETVPTGTLFEEGEDDILDLLDPGSSTSLNSEYDNLLSIANQEEKFADFYASNKAFFLWGNYSGVIVDNRLKPLVDNNKFSELLSGLKRDFDRVFHNIHNFISGGHNAFIMLSTFNKNRRPVIGAKFSSENNFALTADYWNNFDKEARETLTGKAELEAYDEVLMKYTMHIAVGSDYDLINADWYDNFIKEKEKRIRTRYFENKVNGFPIDLFPTNQITLSSEEAWKNMGFDNKQGLDSVPSGNSGWLRSSYGDFFTRDILPTTDKRYFYGAYFHSGEGHEALHNPVNAGIVRYFQRGKPANFYAGFLNNIKCGADLPPAINEMAIITGVVSGTGVAAQTLPFDLVNSGMVLGLSIGRDANGQFVLTGSGQAPTSGYAGIPKLGYSIPPFQNVGKLSSNFSCFSPIFTQEPIDTICKIGQAPTFRVEAVDYHSIPEDKMKNARYSEINYWTSKLKLTDKNNRNLYPLKYKWYRVKNRLTSRGWAVGKEDLVTDIQKTKAFDHAPIKTGYALSVIESTIGHPINWAPEIDVELSDPAGWTKANILEIGTIGNPPRQQVVPRNSHQPDVGDRTEIVFNPEYRTLYANPMAEEASITGDWDCLEGDNSKECTVCHPKESVFYNGTSFVTGITMNPLENNTFIKGAKIDDDEQYSYFCVISGRFGHRMSELASLKLEKFVTFDMSMMVGLPVELGGLYVKKEGYIPLLAAYANGGVIAEWNRQTVVFSYSKQTPQTVARFVREVDYPYVPVEASVSLNSQFFGFRKDQYVLNEQVIEENINMSNNCVSYSFVGPEGWRGYLRSYTPSTQAAVNGVVSKRSHWKDYGPLLTLRKDELTQTEGDLLYGVKTLPTCTNHVMHNLNKGVTSTTSVMVKLAQRGFTGGRPGNSFRAAKVRHKNVGQKAFVTNNSRVGLRSFQYEGIPQLYPPGAAGIRTGGGTHSVGIWQFHNNIGSIKRFGVGHQVPDVDITVDASRSFNVNTSPAGSPRASAETQDHRVIAAHTFKQLFGGSSLGGDCGFHPEAVGANLLYFVENFQRFYIGCSAKGTAKGRTRNFSYTVPGLRFGTSIVQYNWLGKPSSTYLKRKIKAGPYAYEWKVIRHNRDRRGNGWSEGFWSSFWEKKMYLYDQPAVYGLYPTGHIEPNYKAKVKQLKLLRLSAERATDLQIARLEGEAEREKVKVLLGLLGWSRPALLVRIVLRLLYEQIRLSDRARADLFGKTRLTFVRVGPAKGPKNSCGGMRVACAAVGANGEDQLFRSPETGLLQKAAVCEWLDLALHIGPTPRTSYGCTKENLDKGICFDPCLSLKYTQGFYPGGKKLSLTGGFIETNAITTTTLVSEEQYKDLVLSSSTASTRGSPFINPNSMGAQFVYGGLLAAAPLLAGVIAISLRPRRDVLSPRVIRSIMRGPRKSVSPCKDGGADHCNYLTPVINIGEACALVGEAGPDANLKSMFGGIPWILSFNIDNEYVAPKNVT
ncbi:MAG: hypothetical protein EXS69_02555 [Candidatus Zambryskibacteria bacterium]|nr:hypothetical protein [Candidatus Zambryskibacteria bacterium]